MLVVGLGNPGGEYGAARHNVGRMVATALKRKRAQFPAHHLGSTFMNESGPAVLKLLGNARPESLAIIHDDLDLPLGMVRIRKGGGSAGHRGVQSIIESLGTEGFWRVRIGINRPPEGVTPEDYVLQPFSYAEKEQVKQVIDHVVETLVSSEAAEDKLDLSLESGLTDQTITIE